MCECTHTTQYSKIKDAALGPEKSLDDNQFICTAKDTVLSLTCLAKKVK